MSFSTRTLGGSEVCFAAIDQSRFLNRDTERERRERERVFFLTHSTDTDVCLYVCVIYLTVSEVSLQLGDFLPQLLQLLLAGLHLLPLFSFLPLPLILQPLDDALLDRWKRGRRDRGDGSKKDRREERRG